MDILRIENISLDMDGRQILKDLNLSVRAGTVHSVLGPNAAGKSSLAYTIIGCCDYFPQKGTIRFLDQEITNTPLNKRAKMGMTLAWQEPARFEGLAVRDYIAVGMPEKNNELINEALHHVLLNPNDYRDRVVDKTLSGGERKRIELAAVFAMQPKLVILDEPDSGIDMLALDKIIGMIKTLRKKGSTVLLITHREEVAEIADRTSLMCSGRIVKEGKSKEVSRYFKNLCVPCPTKTYPCETETGEKK